MKNRLIYINIAVFCIFLFLRIIFALFRIEGYDEFLSYFEVPSNLDELLYRPWSLLTYMFLHLGIFHILFNLLWLYWLAVMFLREYSQRHLVGLYILGGLGGALVFVLAYNIFPLFDDVVSNSYLIGASASVLAVMGALLYRIPNYELQLFIFGRIKFKYIAAFIIATDLLFMLDNPGQHFAHLGGTLTGLAFAAMYDKGFDIVKWINAILDFLVYVFLPVQEFFVKMCRMLKEGRKPKMKVHYGTSKRSSDYEENMRHRSSEIEIDAILEKIKKSGYGALTDEEKRKLFDASRK